MYLFKQLWSLLLLFAILLGSSCRAQDTPKALNVSDVTFESIFGTKSPNADTTYCLLGTGFFRAPASKNSDSLIAAWIAGHPQASVIPVSTLGRVREDRPKSGLTYCWVISGNDTLNNYLIRSGCFPGGTMMRPKTWTEMEQWEKDLYDGMPHKPNVQVHVAQKVYDNFLSQIRAAEKYAREHKLGIWPEEERRAAER